MEAVHKELVLYGVEAEDANEAIDKVGNVLYTNGYVRETYVPAVKEREVDYPTGLQLNTYGVAMPHTAGVHVNTPAICVAKLAKPVIFGHMGEPERKVEARILFMMAIKDPNKQLEMLQSMMGVFTNDEAMLEFDAAKNEQELYEVAAKYLNS
ncbi:MAG: PTS sugar transporter subunit IIA [Atopobiaceae bacterium]|jgi:PTS system galactitol-specific IIA component|nr:PTS sugar transporter subunit IIA [Atopobiaceae bacterium]MCH4120505.1 PTS sugar transporter subunit IIA [Atopobiaceae bacterium]MCI1318731.1 PTS sugar transporter subunit IIA [Atopobiaceae bacterium]MCI1388206.1 PTS sugar transporter subunit IIA [Atopobiaceae bacterium]MCI1431544.1 PTS sugar transporter subunit IIA [Atopobiaceae bacterium]